MAREIWLPKSETKVTVQDGVVYIRDEMVMTPRPIAPQAGFAPAYSGTTRDDMRRDTVKPR